MIKRKITFQWRGIVFPLVAIALLFCAWHYLVKYFAVNESILPSPVNVFSALFEEIQTGVLWKHIIASLYRVLAGFLLASVFAIPLGLLIGTYFFLRTALLPIVQAFRTISPISWIPLAIMWFGIGDKPAIFIIFITAFFPIIISTILAVKQVNPLYLKVGKNFGADKSALLSTVILPSIVPFIMIALKVSLGISWVIIVAAEMVGMQSGLGFMILDARNFLRTDLIIAGMIVIGIVGLMLDYSLGVLERFIKYKMGYE